MKRLTSIIPFILIAGIMFSGCKKSTDTPPVVTTTASVTNSFVWNSMHDYYLWTADVPALSNPSYATASNLDAFLNTYSDPNKLFTGLLFRSDTIDKWSFIEDNSKTITDWIAGISQTQGFDFMLGRIASSDTLFGFVRYIYKGSPAEKAGMKRGDIFVKVNDTKLTVSNYQTLLFTNLTYTLSFATIVNHTITPNTRTVTMTAINMQENPILMDTVFTFINQKIGYLVYNGFNADFDFQLNDVIQKFKDANIGQMVLDLRYNGGGSVQTSTYLASMIYGTDNTKLFAKAQYNQAYQAAIISQYGSSALDDNFTNTIDATSTTQPTPINTINLKKIYFIVSDNTASASELLINGLRPYMNVKVVGINTTGKYVGSITLTDAANPSDPWAMQPIVVKFANSLGVTDFVNGLTPDIIAEEDIANLLPFGDPNEALLKVVLTDIQGTPVTAMTLKSAQMGLKKVFDSRSLRRHGKDMYINPDKFKGLKIAHLIK